jgi:hypothetical protein
MVEKAVHFMVDKKELVREDLGINYNLQNHVSSDLLPPSWRKFS